MQGLQSLKRTDAYRGNARTYRNAIAYLFASNPDKHLANVFLESDFCISCFFEVSASRRIILRLYDYGLVLPHTNARRSLMRVLQPGCPRHVALLLCTAAPDIWRRTQARLPTTLMTLVSRQKVEHYD